MRCVNMLSRLWNSPSTAEATGCSITGSSEAAMLGGLALKRRWQQSRRAAGKGTDRPNMVMGINVQICWEKFCNYFEVEPRYVPMEGNRFHLSGEEAAKLCDENTIGVVAVLGYLRRFVRAGRGDLGRLGRPGGAHGPGRGDPRRRGFRGHGRAVHRPRSGLGLPP